MLKDDKNSVYRITCCVCIYVDRLVCSFKTLRYIVTSQSNEPIARR